GLLDEEDVPSSKHSSDHQRTATQQQQQQSRNPFLQRSISHKATAFVKALLQDQNTSNNHNNNNNSNHNNIFHQQSATATILPEVSPTINIAPRPKAPSSAKPAIKQKTPGQIISELHMARTHSSDSATGASLTSPSNSPASANSSGMGMDHIHHQPYHRQPSMDLQQHSNPQSSPGGGVAGGMDPLTVMMPRKNSTANSSVSNNSNSHKRISNGPTSALSPRSSGGAGASGYLPSPLSPRSSIGSGSNPSLPRTSGGSLPRSASERSRQVTSTTSSNQDSQNQYGLGVGLGHGNVNPARLSSQFQFQQHFHQHGYHKVDGTIVVEVPIMRT
ncbi:hypothetical protein HDU76_012245, partial [Blyttiomyces sp. JEL0837]